MLLMIELSATFNANQPPFLLLVFDYSARTAVQERLVVADVTQSCILQLVVQYTQLRKLVP
jgi:hypothetical protein